MQIRTFYWHDRVISKPRYVLRKILGRNVHHQFLTGNAGDIITRDIIDFIYGLSSNNIREGGKRLLCVGSIGHAILPGDIVCGIGIKNQRVPEPAASPCTIYGLRGPISYDVFKKAGHDLSEIRFLKDPGLLLRFIARSRNRNSNLGKVIFIPHYRERNQYGKLPKGIEVVNIDASPVKLAAKIQSAGLVYSSSLHGIIFAHALNRPCVVVHPQTEEPLTKYEDYFSSVDLQFRNPLESIYAADFKKSPNSPPDLKYKIEDFYFPPIDYLREKGIAETGKQ